MIYYSTYILVVIGALLCMAASAHVNSVYRKYARVASTAGLTGAETAERILRMNGITDVSIGHVRGELTDHYDPSRRIVNLSDATYGSRSVAAIGVAAHECGHVVQHHTGYFPLSVRTALVPVANLGSNLGLPMVIIGLFLGAGVRLSDGGTSIGTIIAEIGVILFACGVLFQIVTLPVEFDASHRALKMLKQYQILDERELSASRKVLTAAALTYVAAAASSILQLLRLILIAGGGRRRDD